MTRNAIITLTATVLVALSWNVGHAQPAAAAAKKKVLYITTTAGFHHDACEYSVPVFKKMAADSGLLDVTASDKTDLITPESLKGFDAVVFSNTSGGKGQFPLSDENGMALINFVKGGKAFIGIHAATDTLADWEPYADMIGGSFNGHPWTKKVKVDVEDPAHPSAVHLPSPWYVDDEIYTFKNWSRDKAHVILSMDVSGEEDKGNREDRDYALAWCKPYGEGRVFYTAFGHKKQEVWDDPSYQKHLLSGVLWALKMAPQDILLVVNPEVQVDNADNKQRFPYPGDCPLALGRKKPGEWQKIFDGKTLSFGTDWEVSEKKSACYKHWTVLPGGILQGDSRGTGEGSSHLYYIKRPFGNFEYRAEVCINKEGNSGMYFRCLENRVQDGRKVQWSNWPAGYEAQVNNGWDPDPRKSGTFYPEPSLRAADLAKAIGYDKAKDDDNFWFTQHIIAVGDHVVIKLNGKVVADRYTDQYKEGFFAFQMHHEGSVVKFRNIEVRQLP